MEINNKENINTYFHENLDFEKMNATLANPEFANWYYNQMYSKSNNSDATIEDFVKIVKDYSEEKSK